MRVKREGVVQHGQRREGTVLTPSFEEIDQFSLFLFSSRGRRDMRIVHFDVKFPGCEGIAKDAVRFESESGRT